nr:hypothetical protein [Sinorhizobium meliloti]
MIVAKRKPQAPVFWPLSNNWILINAIVYCPIGRSGGDDRRFLLFQGAYWTGRSVVHAHYRHWKLSWGAKVDAVAREGRPIQESAFFRRIVNGAMSMAGR